MSFSLTTEQIRKRIKTVTRRKGCVNLKPGTILNACVKCMGLKPGERVEKICQIRVVDVYQEPLESMDEAGFGDQETVLEGFPEMTGKEFVTMFCRHMGGRRDQEVTRIEFEYVNEVSNEETPK